MVMGIDRPRVAVLSANEKQIPSLPSTWIGRSLAQRSWPHALVSGPLSFDLATDPESVSVKGLPDIPNARDVAGKADILVCPSIDAANILYKTFTAMTKFGQASMAGVTVGFPVPYIILSRADPLETRLLSIALCSIYAQRKVDRGDHREAAETEVRERTYGGEGAPVRSRVDGRHADSREYAEGMIRTGHAMDRILVINPGSTSLKLALYSGQTPSHDVEIERNTPRLNSREAMLEECGAVVELVLETLAGWNAGVDAIAARGGFVRRPAGKLSSGTYVVAERGRSGIEVDRNLVDAIIENPEMEHASNLGIPVASELAQKLQVPAYVVDPVIVDEFRPVAELSGYAPIQRVSIGHALSVHAAARKAAQQIGRPLQDVNLVVAHLGGGITVAAVRGGRVVDSNMALLGDGPFTPQRAGTLPLSGIVDLCYSGRFGREELVEELSKRGGIYSYLGEHRMEALQDRVEAGDEQAKLVIDAMVYRIAGEIGSMYMALECNVEALVLTGGLMRSPLVRLPLRKRGARLAPVFVFEGSLEMEALARGVSEVLLGRTDPRRFPGEGA
jgi:butyrate kinase